MHSTSSAASRGRWHVSKLVLARACLLRACCSTSRQEALWRCCPRRAERKERERVLHSAWRGSLTSQVRCGCDTATASSSSRWRPLPTGLTCRAPGRTGRQAQQHQQRPGVSCLAAGMRAAAAAGLGQQGRPGRRSSNWAPHRERHGDDIEVRDVFQQVGGQAQVALVADADGRAWVARARVATVVAGCSQQPVR